METKKALKRLTFWFLLAVIFNVIIYIFMGKKAGLEFLGGYVIEQSLSLDNLFLFLLIFESFGINPSYQRRVLTYGIFGAMILRLIFILLGVTIVNRFHFILYIFGVILLISGFKMMFKSEEKHDFKNNVFFKLLVKIMPVTKDLYGENFFTRIDSKLYATPLFAILIIIESSDILFAVDSIPAVFSITTNPFIVYTSNIFAILGLRNMYFLLEKLHNKFKYVKYGVALILVFTGLKLFILFWNIEIPLGWSLLTIFLIMLLSILASSLNKKF